MYRVPVYKIQLIRDQSVNISQRPSINEPATVAEIVRTFLAHADREYFVVIMVDTKNKIIGINQTTSGTIDRSFLSLREIFKPVFLANAAKIILAHNHPSGDPTPSEDDRQVTIDIVAAGKLLGVPVLDHIIIGDGTSACFSFAEHRLI